MDRKSTLGFILIFIIIMLLPVYYRLISPKSPTPVTPTDTTRIAQTKITSPEKSPFHLLTPTIPTPSEEKIHVIETQLYRLTISSNAGGSIKRVALKKYMRSIAEKSKWVELTPAGESNPLLIRCVGVNGDSIKLDQNFFVEGDLASKDTINLAPEDSISLVYILRNGKTIIAKRTFTFYGDKYSFKQSIDLSNFRDQLAVDQFDLSWEGGLLYTEEHLNEEVMYSKAYAYSGGDIEQLDVKSGKTAKTKFLGATNWTAIRTKYFTVAFIPEKPALGFNLTAQTIPLTKREFQKVFNMYLSLPASTPTNITTYIGPLDYQNLRSFNLELENIMNFGGSIIRPISKLFLWAFTGLHKFIPNYGVVLIIFSLLIKLLLTPLTNISTRSMLEMQKLQPQIEALREKYGSDPQRLNAETMKLYKEHGVNPMSGCLPLLLQLPILWALFIIFRTTIELRHAHFILWIKDLSSPDSILTLPFKIPLYGDKVNVLPILMVITQIFQQKVSGATVNPQQKVQMWIMTIFFFFIFNQFPSGLNLYYTLFNILSIVQQKYFPPKPKPKRKRKSAKELLRELQSQSRRRHK